MNILFSRRLLVGLLGLLALASNVSAQDFRIGFINQDRILREANIAKAAQAKLEQEFARREKELVEQGAALKAASDKFEREAPTLSESQRNARQKALIDQDRDLLRRRREFQEDANARKGEELQQLFDRVSKAVKVVAEAEKYDLIMQVQEAVYFNPRHDVTEKVVRALNAANGAK
ncbi:MAG: OmpH family outer membrane protein [Ramlibacter sp.]|jgi:outer membrane protein|nr:OmpH family outer membrane protein [Ramlibacter sp.]